MLKNLENIVTNLSRYSSGDNCQPFFFQIDESALTIKIFHDYEIAKHPFNPENLSSILSLGVIVQMMEELSKEYSFKSKFELMINKSNFNSRKRIHWGTFTITGMNQEIPKKNIFLNVVTDRKPYNEIEINLPLLDNDIKIATQLEESEIELILKSEEKTWSTPEHIVAVFEWIFFSYNRYKKLKQGIYYKEANMEFSEALLISSLRSPFLVKILTKLKIVKILALKKTKSVIRKTPNIIGVFAEITSPIDLVEVGKKAFLMKYEFSKKGIVTQPLSSATLPYIYNLLNCCDYGSGAQYKNIQIKFKDKFNNQNKNHHLVWMFRAGTPVSSLPPSLRKDFSDILLR
ncbi:MAG: hypothetical protein H7177_00500 [Rhizobacter sp.]|nr:hypothetical protein [Bacteriovorax sp.]